MIKKVVFALICLLYNSIGYSQNMAYSRSIVDTLSSSAFWGRGYTKDGMEKAGDFIADQFKSFGLLPLHKKNYKQQFTYSVNTFPGRMELTVNDKKLVPGKDFILLPDSRNIHAKGMLQQIDSTHFINKNYRFIISLHDKLTWSVAENETDFTEIQLSKKVLNEIPVSFQADIENKVIEKFSADNICGMVKGTLHPDSFVVITAHYDHLGGMGKEVYFPGANDNASGTALLLSLAKYYAAHPQNYSMVFISFAGEEAGLKGSKFFTEHPLIALSNIRFLINLDLQGTGVDGITVVNATEFPREFKLLNDVNNAKKYLTKINARGKAANSDHYWFTEKGVPAFFWYTLGGIAAYHDVWDKPETLPLNEIEDLFNLIQDFIEGLLKQ